MQMWKVQTSLVYIHQNPVENAYNCKLDFRNDPRIFDSVDGSQLKEELDIEKQLRARLEKELKDIHDAQEDEKNRHKNIVLLLLTERKRILKQFMEERKRSADLSAMLEDEKRQALSMAEGLEEESQKVHYHPTSFNLLIMTSCVLIMIILSVRTVGAENGSRIRTSNTELPCRAGTTYNKGEIGRGTTLRCRKPIKNS